MKLNEYQKLAMRTANVANIDNAIFGLIGEVGELADMVKKHKFQGHELDTEKCFEELGDILWYVALTAEALGEELDDVAECNIAKLKDRYPEGFKEKDSINREE